MRNASWPWFRNFARSLGRRQRDIARQVKDIADADSTRWQSLSRADADPSAHVDDAQPLAAAHNLDFLELVSGTGGIISSAQWPARFLYQEDWMLRRDDWDTREPFFKREDLPSETALALISRAHCQRGGSKMYTSSAERGSTASFSLRSCFPPACARCSIVIHNR